MKLPAFFLLVLILASCKSSTTDNDINIPEAIVSVDTVQIRNYRVLLTNSDYPELSLQNEDVKNADALLHKSVEAFNKADKRQSINLRYYVRHYVPRLNENGEMEVVIYGSCQVDGGNKWRTGVQDVLDGGNCYFQVIVNLNQNTFGPLIPNGEA